MYKGRSMKKVVIINGHNGVGKDTFVKYVQDNIKATNYSSISAVKEIAGMIGWKGTKTSKDRQMLSDLKVLLGEYNDFPMKSMKEKYRYFLTRDDEILFLHIREPEEIEKAKKEFNAITVLIKNDRARQETNMADARVFDYTYDYYIDNSETFESLEVAAKLFIDSIKLEEKGE